MELETLNEKLARLQDLSEDIARSAAAKENQLTLGKIERVALGRLLRDAAIRGALTGLMSEFRGNQSRAAAVLGYNRATVRQFINRTGFKFQDREVA